MTDDKQARPTRADKAEAYLADKYSVELQLALILAPGVAIILALVGQENEKAFAGQAAFWISAAAYLIQALRLFAKAADTYSGPAGQTKLWRMVGILVAGALPSIAILAVFRDMADETPSAYYLSVAGNAAFQMLVLLSTWIMLLVARPKTET